MKVAELKRQIMNKELLDFYVFCGDEWELQNVYLKQISKVRGLPITRIDSIADIYSSLSNRSFLSKSALYVVRDDKDILYNEKVQTALKRKILGDNTLILLLTNVDKRTKFYKAFIDRFVEFEKMPEANLKKYIQRHVDLADREYDELIDICECDYGRLLLEVDKIKRSSFSFRELVDSGIIHREAGDVIFDFVEAVVSGRVEDSFALYNECIEHGENVLAILSVLYNNIKYTLQVQSCNSSDITKATGLQLWLVNKIRKNANVYSNSELLAAMKHIHEWEMGIKLGCRDSENAIEIILEKLF